MLIWLVYLCSQQHNVLKTSNTALSFCMLYRIVLYLLIFSAFAWGSSVIKVSGHEQGDGGSTSGRETFVGAFRLSLGPTKSPIQWISWVVKRKGKIYIHGVLSLLPYTSSWRRALAQGQNYIFLISGHTYIHRHTGLYHYDTDQARRLIYS